MKSGYLIRGGDTYDGTGTPAQRLDVRVHDKVIREIGVNLPERGERVVDASGLIVAPGLIDLHVHVFSGMGLYSVDPGDGGLRTGVTTLLDTGTAGALTFETFHRFIIAAGKEDVFALLNISQIGAIQGHPDVDPYIGDLNEARHAHVPSAVACVNRHRDRIVGLKVRLTAGLANYRLENEHAGWRGALEAAEKTGLPLMVHHAASQIPTGEMFDSLRAGDIFTHLYHPNPDHPFSGRDGAPCLALQRARDRGVLVDVGHGVGAFAWTIAEPACQQHGFWPDTISTDLHQFNLHGPVFDLPTTMSKFLFLGMPLARVIQAVTGTPARAMGRADCFGRLLEGRPADLTLLRIKRGLWPLVDVRGETRIASERIAAVMAFKGGQPHSCASPMALVPALFGSQGPVAAFARNRS